MPKITLTEEKPKKQRIQRTGLDLDNVPIFSAKEIPPSTRTSIPFKELLRKLDRGQATYITDRQVSLGTASQRLRELLKTPEFKGYTAYRRTVEGEKRLYIENGNKS
jgi:hypothetical protein